MLEELFDLSFDTDDKEEHDASTSLFEYSYVSMQKKLNCVIIITTYTRMQSDAFAMVSMKLQCSLLMVKGGTIVRLPVYPSADCPRLLDISRSLSPLLHPFFSPLFPQNNCNSNPDFQNIVQK